MKLLGFTLVGDTQICQLLLAYTAQNWTNIPSWTPTHRREYESPRLVPCITLTKTNFAINTLVVANVINIMKFHIVNQVYPTYLGVICCTWIQKWNFTPHLYIFLKISPSLVVCFVISNIAQLFIKMNYQPFPPEHLILMVALKSLLLFTLLAEMHVVKIPFKTLSVNEQFLGHGKVQLSVKRPTLYCCQPIIPCLILKGSDHLTLTHLVIRWEWTKTTRYGSLSCWKSLLNTHSHLLRSPLRTLLGPRPPDICLSGGSLLETQNTFFIFFKDN